jgi:CspA family cold shock protein
MHYRRAWEKIMANNLKAVLGSVAACGVLLLAGCASGTTASTPSVASSAAVPEVSSAAPDPSAPVSSAPAEVPAEQVLAKWSCAKDGEEVTCICEGSEADCKSTVAEPSTVKGASSGTVNFFNDSRGFGFITESGSGREIFVHVTGLVDNIREGDYVCFTVNPGKKGINAVLVRQC